MVFCCSCCWMEYAASASACAVSACRFSSARFKAKSLFFMAMAVSASTRASLASLSAWATCIFTSRSAMARLIDASFLILAVLSAPKSCIRPSLSVTFCMLHEMISIPNLAMSCCAFCITWSENPSRSVFSERRSSVPIISRMLPCNESCSCSAIIMGVMLRKFLAAKRVPSAFGVTLIFATASTSTLIKSVVGTLSSVLMSTVICPRYTRSSRSKKGIRNPPEPISTRGSRLRPDMM